MSTALAIGAVTAVLKDLLNDGLINANLSAAIGTSIEVNTLPPDQITQPGDNVPSQINLYMYMATPNQGWRNVGLPSRDGDGNRLTNPPLAVDLHYMLTAYGARDFHAEILLGYGMQLMFETPVLPRDRIRATLGAPGLVPPGGGLPSTLTALATSGLADQIEQIKISPQALSVDDMFKLWSAFQTHYRPSACYLVTVVLIESRRPTPSAPPVRVPRLTVLPFKQPVVESVISSSGEAVYIQPGDSIVINGQRLKAPLTRVNISGQEVAVAGGQLADSRITLDLSTLPGVLSAGVQTLQVAHMLDFKTGSPSEPHHGVESNVAAFVLHPAITGTPATSGVTSRIVNGVTLRSGTLTVDVNPAVGQNQRVTVLLNEMGATTTAQSYSYQAPPRANPAPANAMQVTFTDVPAGDYLVRVQVDGAESALAYDNATGIYNAPKVTI